ncbi:MAG: CsiV family protein [Candidatus Eutrophobiaceae bacterium]
MATKNLATNSKFVWGFSPFLPVLLLALSGAAHAENWYQVEVIALEYRQTQTDSALPMISANVPIAQNPIVLRDPSPNLGLPSPYPANLNVRPPYQRLAGQYLRMPWKKLQNSASYEPILYAAWQVGERSPVHDVLLGHYRNQELLLQAEPTDLSEGFLPKLKVDETSMNDQTFVFALNPITHGYVRIKIGTYIQATVDFMILLPEDAPAQQSLPTASSQGTPIPRRGESGQRNRLPDTSTAMRLGATLHETRNIQLNKLYHFHSSLFAVILRVQKVAENLVDQVPPRMP